MTTQPKTLRLAYDLEKYDICSSIEAMPDFDEVAAELRRIHALNQKLLASLKGSSNYIDHLGGDSSIYRQAIAKAEEK